MPLQPNTAKSGEASGILALSRNCKSAVSHQQLAIRLKAKR
jgi:hypothetical protein